MDFKVNYKGQPQELIEDFIDIGYMAENIKVCDIFNKTFEIKRSSSKKSMTLLISSPNIEFIDELENIDKFMSSIQVPIECYFLFATSSSEIEEFSKDLEIFKVAIDSEVEFGSMYGTKIVNGTLEGKLTKALFLISKDGAVFFLKMLENLEDEFSLERLKVELNRAYVTYTGVGCHG